MHPALVTINELSNPFPALISDNRWNGWLIPYFSFDDAIQILNELEREMDTGKEGVLRFFEPCIGEWLTCQTITVEGTTLYNVADGWTWEYA